MGMDIAMGMAIMPKERLALSKDPIVIVIIANVKKDMSIVADMVKEAMVSAFSYS